MTPQDEPYYLQLLEYYIPDNSVTIISSTQLRRDNTSIAVASNIYKAKFPCGLIAQGGRYGVRIQFNIDTDINEVLLGAEDESGVHVEQSRQKVSEIHVDAK